MFTMKADRKEIHNTSFVHEQL